jgi:hypothetical protein
MRKGVNVLLQRFSKEGGIREAEFIRDTLDGKRSLFDMQGIDSTALTSLQVLFVDAVSRLEQAKNERTIEQLPERQIEGEVVPSKPQAG